MKMPVYRPVRHTESSSTYQQRVDNYGPPPKGYRWLKVGERAPVGSIKSDYYAKRWFRADCGVSGGEVCESFFAVAAPVAVKPADPPKSADSNLLRRIDDLRAKIVADQKLVVTASERLDKYAEVLKALESVK